jgi:hypothetical protein
VQQLLRSWRAGRQFVDEIHNGRYDPWEKLKKDWNATGVRLRLARG